MNDRSSPTIGLVALAVALAAAGWWVSGALLRFRTADRTVTVKGLAEREVPADLVVWPIAFTEAGNDLGVIYEQSQTHARLIGEFLKGLGLGDVEQRLSPPKIQDFAAEGGRENPPPNRYKAEVTYTVRTEKVAEVKQAMARSGELVRAGVAFVPWGAPPTFLYTKLNDLKPGLLAEATQAARRTAEQFAKDSESRVGSIRSANQGQISIVDRDAGTPEVKKVRVVTTVEYELVE
jgi:hypothetical protein